MRLGIMSAQSHSTLNERFYDNDKKNIAEQRINFKRRGLAARVIRKFADAQDCAAAVDRMRAVLRAKS